MGRGIVDFAAFAKSLRAIGYEGPSVFEIISQRPDEEIVESHRRLAAWGWEKPKA